MVQRTWLPRLNCFNSEISIIVAGTGYTKLWHFLNIYALISTLKQCRHMVRLSLSLSTSINVLSLSLTAFKGGFHQGIPCRTHHTGSNGPPLCSLAVVVTGDVTTQSVTTTVSLHKAAPPPPPLVL